MPGSKTWFTWSTEAGFDAWHTTVVAGLDLPRVGYNAATQEPAPDAQGTTAYTAVIKIADGDWRAPVEQCVASSYPDGLGLPTDPPPAPEDI